MGSKKQIEGTCLCGNVKISIETENGTFDVCHCGMCRKWGGGPAFTIDSGERFDISGKESVATYKSSEWAERGFCKNCGTHLFYRLLEADFYNFSFGLFESTQEFKFQSQIFIDSKPHSYEFANITEKLTETEVLAKFKSSPTSK